MSKRPIILREGHHLAETKGDCSDVLDNNAVSKCPRVVYTTSRKIVRMAVWAGYSVKRFNPGIYKLTCGRPPARTWG